MKIAIKITVPLPDRKITGLKLNQAQVSCIGGSLAEEVCKMKNFKSHKTCIKTADSRQQIVYGNLKIPVCFRDKSYEINFYVVPSLTQEIILGIDFWKNFQIAPNIVSELDLDRESKISYEAISLSDVQESQLERVKNLFPSYERKGWVKLP